MAVGDLALRPDPAAITRRGMTAAVRLGYEIEANWTHPAIYVVYALVRPLSTTLLLYFMYVAIGKGRAGNDGFLAYALIGNAL
jgi:hypothetical protein